MTDAERQHTADIARLQVAVQNVEEKVDEGAQAVRDGFQALRSDLQGDMREIREGVAADVSRMAANMLDISSSIKRLHEFNQDPKTGVIRRLDDHEQRLATIEQRRQHRLRALAHVGMWATLAVIGFFAAGIVKYAEPIGRWIASIGNKEGASP